MKFELKSPFKPTGDQPQAIEKLTRGINQEKKDQVLLGVTGSGKTFTIANVIYKTQRPALVISHNKTLAAQLYQELRDFFPQNAVGYFVSYYDYYQPEAYIVSSDTYIEKETDINEEIDKLRLQATANVLERKDTIIVSSVSCIYNLGSPEAYEEAVLSIKKGEAVFREELINKLVRLYYVRSHLELKRGQFRVRGDILDIALSYKDQGIRVEIQNNKIKKIMTLDILNGSEIDQTEAAAIYPAKHFVSVSKSTDEVFSQIRSDLEKQVKELTSKGKRFEAQRLEKRVNYDLEMIAEVGYVNGIENYSRYFDGREKGEPPFTLIDYFNYSYQNNWLTVIDESHMTIPQINGMYAGDLSRKKTLVEFGFRLPAAFDNRPLKFEEFLGKISQTIYVSATPSSWEIKKSKGSIIEQMIRPTGIVDPKIKVKETKNQIIDLVSEIIKRKKKGERILVTTLTKKTAEDLTKFLNEKKYLKWEEFNSLEAENYPLVWYLHSDIETLVRSNILDDLRSGKYDVVVGINLLREGLDLPEVTLVAILDADKEGFLRSKTSLIQTMGRAARHVNGQVIMYADSYTKSIKRAISEIDRRRKIQKRYNAKHSITPKTIKKPIRKKLIKEQENEEVLLFEALDMRKRLEYRKMLEIDYKDLIPRSRKKLLTKMKKEMTMAASNLNFELAAEIRDKIIEIEKYHKAGVTGT